MRTWLVALMLALPVQAAAQGDQAGVLTGRITTAADGEALPGASVTVTSPALQGAREAFTDVNGVYLLRALPPGEYTVVIEMPGVARAERLVRVPLGGRTQLDEALALSVSANVEVRAAAPALLRRQADRNFLEVDTRLLPLGRTPFLMTDLSGGLTDNTPNAGQVTISGAFAYDNVWLVNGVDVNDNVLGRANDLYIEEAVQEVQVLGSSISAEYGRFSGGVVNVITKSGGDAFSGSLRSNLTNPAWSDETPFESAQRTSKLAKVYEGVVGGPVLKGRLWFFGAARSERSEAQGALPQTGLPLVTKTMNTRYELKLTGTLRPGRTVRGSYINNDLNTEQASLPFTIDPVAYVYPHTPNTLAVVNYQDLVGSKLLVTGQFSQKRWGVRDQGNTSLDIQNSPFLTRTGGLFQYNAPYFDSTDPEDRNNRQFTGSASYFASSPSLGSHDVKGGVEHFMSTRVGGNSQTSTGYVFQSNFAAGTDGKPLIDANGRLVPNFVPGTSRLQTWLPTRGASIDISTLSLYLQDRITAGPHWGFNLGVRYERVGSEATAVAGGISASTLAPRLSAQYDLNADGRTVLRTSYAHYAGKYHDVQFARNTNVGNADLYTRGYTGPAGQGLDFAPGFDPANYTTLISGSFPRANVSFADDLSSPLTREFTAGVDRQISAAADIHLTYVQRHASRFVDDFITIDNGKTLVARDGITFGTFDNVVWKNTDIPRREYKALDVQGSVRVRRNVRVWGDYTIQLANDGNFEGEGANTPAIGSFVGDYPEMLVADRTFPMGRLDDFQRHRLRIWGAYNLSSKRFGALDVAPVWRVNSGRAYSLAATGVPLTAVQAANNPGYAGVPTQTLFFGERGSQFFKGYGLFDVALNYGIPVWRSVSPWVKLEVLNVLNNQKQISWDTTVAPDNAGPKDQYGLPLDYIQGARFGQATRTADYPRPRPGIDGGRTFIVMFGARF
ncbi:MAG: carboxypeptidase regulatory-like domain-containing protein [Vicinamibacterales bacterium]